MKIFRKVDEIDMLEAKQRDLEAAKEEVISKTNLKNNKIGARRDRLEEIMFHNTLAKDKAVEKIDLELEKNAKLIIAASEYAQKLGAKYKKPVSKLKDALDNAELKKDIKDIKNAITKKNNKK